MIAILLSSLLLIFGLICTFSTIPPTKKFLQLWFKSFQPQNPPEDPPKPTFNNNEPSKTKSELRDVFATFDKNNDGFITRQELKESLKNIGISAGETDVADMVEKVDSNGDGLIDFDEFCKLFDSNIISGDNRDGDLREAFDVFDDNKDGLITVEELGLVLTSMGFTEGNKLEDCKEMIRKVDVDGDGMVNFDEFKSMMKSGFGRPIPVS
ncbi:Calmodulin and related proteins (EF-Hand superfamily) [Handroanthus impetiginosus]|uniref:Calmodulin and related proteins (EF-Hand superfamily) n=1 Tax=Handroanthus impetiginosus TaxID=429701 RepID=A0A2G9GWN0_9LAMI|nr:Calmodulin and related proteins (EF-Hand superfamily) [Handroanthus impetiginosus]